jgi:hypothetical protein
VEAQSTYQHTIEGAACAPVSVANQLLMMLINFAKSLAAVSLSSFALAAVFVLSFVVGGPLHVMLCQFQT